MTSSAEQRVSQQ